MSNPGPVSGRYGMVNGQTAVRKWNANFVSAPKKYVHSGTKAGPGRRRGIQDWNGGFDCYGHTPSLLPGVEFTFQGFTAPTTGVVGTNGSVYSGPAIVDSLQMSWNWETGDILSHAISFSGRGAWSKTLGHYEDTSDEDPTQECIDLTITADGETIPNVTQATMNLSSENKTYINSSTGGNTGRKAGVIDCTIGVTVQNTHFDDFVLTIGDYIEIALGVGDAGEWIFSKMHLKDFSGIETNIETGDIIKFTANFEYSYLTKDEEDELVRGYIMLPDGTIFHGDDPTP